MVANPANPQLYSIQLPAGSYRVYAFIDRNGNNVEDFGDTTQQISALAVSGAATTQDIAMPTTPSAYTWFGGLNNVQIVNSYGSTRQRYVNWIDVVAHKRLVAAEITSGPGIIAPQDFAISYFYNQGPVVFLGEQVPLLPGATPKVGDAYNFQVTFGDGSSQNFVETVKSVPGTFGSNPTPSGVGTDLTPDFSWTDPPNASGYSYGFWLNADGPLQDPSKSVTWSIPGSSGSRFSDSIDSLTWGVDPTGGGNQPSKASLLDGSNYEWSINALDSSSNESELLIGYYPGYTDVYLPAANPGTLGAATVGQSYAGAITANNGTAPYTFTVNGLFDGLTSSSSGGTLTISGTPIAAGVVSFQVSVIDSNNKTWGPVTYTINVGN